MAQTALDLIKGSLRLINVLGQGETPTAEDGNDALTVLNMMLDQWTNESLAVYQILTESFSIVAGTEKYSIGPSGDFDTTRPIRIDNVYVRDVNNNDYKLAIIQNDEYQNITVKSTTSTYPSYMMYERTHPLGYLYFWAVPSQNLTCFLSQLKQLKDTDLTLTTTLAYPPGYDLALRYNLAVLLAPEYGKTASPSIFTSAAEAKEAIQITNYAGKPPQSMLDRTITRQRPYNIYTDVIG